MKRTRLLTVASLLGLFLAGCASQETPPHPIGRSVYRAKGDSNMYDVSDDDVQMDHAVQRARRTVPQFVEALRHPAPGDRNFGVKKLFVKDGKAEHIWLTNVQFIGNRFVGLVDNHPRNIAGLKVGDKVSVNPNEISDWLYVHDGQMVGGYTVRVLLTELTPAEKEDFLKQAGFQIPQ